MHGPLLLNLHAYIQQYPPKIATSLQTREQLRSTIGDDDDDHNDDDNDNDKSGQQREQWSHDGMR